MTISSSYIVACILALVTSFTRQQDAFPVLEFTQPAASSVRCVLHI